MTQAVRPIIGRVGGKSRMAPKIAEIIRQQAPWSVYVEPFCGSAAVYFKLVSEGFFEQIKARGHHPRVVLNDADKAIMNLYKVCRDLPELLAHQVYFTPYSRAEHKEAQQKQGDVDDLEEARRSLVDNWQRQNGGDGGWRYAKYTDKTIGGEHGTAEWNGLPDRILAAAEHLGDRQLEQARRSLVANWQAFTKLERKNAEGNGNVAWSTTRSDVGVGDVEVWNTLGDRILCAAQTLKSVYLECDDACKIIDRWQSPNTLFYLDPPYLDCEHYYSEAWGIEDHHRLAELLNTVEAAGIVLSYYPDDRLNDLYPEDKWERQEFEAVASSAGITRNSKTKTRPKRTELVLIRKTEKIQNFSGQFNLFAV